MIFNAPDYIDVLTRFFPTSQFHAMGDHPVAYEAIAFQNGVVLQSALDAKLLQLAQEQLSAVVRAQAEAARVRITVAILGTTDHMQLMAYDIKYKEAAALLADPTADSAFLSAEAAVSGETVATLAAAVKFEYEAVQASLKPFYGNIDGLRRVHLTQIATATTVQELLELPEINWGV